MTRRIVLGEVLGNRWQRLQRERLLPAARTKGDTSGDRGGAQLFERRGLDVRVTGKPGVWKCTSRLSAPPKHWISVTAPVCARLGITG